MVKVTWDVGLVLIEWLRLKHDPEGKYHLAVYSMP